MNTNPFGQIHANIKCEFNLICVRDMITTYSQMHHTDNYSQHSSMIWSVCPNYWVFTYKLSGCGFKSPCSHLNFRYHACFEQGVSWHCGFTVICARDMITTCSQIHCIDKYSQHSLIIWPVWPNGWVFVYNISGCGFKSRCSHLNFRHCACFKQRAPWHSGQFRVWIDSEMRTWHDKNIHSNALYR